MKKPFFILETHPSKFSKVLILHKGLPVNSQSSFLYVRKQVVQGSAEDGKDQRKSSLYLYQKEFKNNLLQWWKHNMSWIWIESCGSYQ